MPEPNQGNAKPTPDGALDKVKKIVKTLESSRIDDMTVDVLTAQTVVDVYKRLSAKKKEQFAKLPIKKMICKAFELSEKGE